MKVICTDNALSDELLSPIHREYFESLFGKNPPSWRAEIGRSYTVYGVKISRGYPFYFVERSGPAPKDWGFIPSLCFEVVDDRPSSLWRLRTGIVADHRGNQIFVTNLAIREWFDEPNFHLNVVEMRPREVEMMEKAAVSMDAEFGT